MSCAPRQYRERQTGAKVLSLDLHTGAFQRIPNRLLCEAGECPFCCNGGFSSLQRSTRQGREFEGVLLLAFARECFDVLGAVVTSTKQMNKLNTCAPHGHLAWLRLCGDMRWEYRPPAWVLRIQMHRGSLSSMMWGFVDL